MHIFDMSFKIYDALFKRLNIFGSKLCFRHAAVIFERPDSCNEDNAGGLKACKAALDIKELFSA